MINFTQNNHLVYTIADVPYGHRKSSIDKFKVSVGAVDPDQYLRSNFELELRRTADSIYQEFGKDLVVFLSGGTDSEIVAKNFVSIGVRPKCVTIQFKDDFNQGDVYNAKNIANDLGLDLEIIDFDILDFYKSGEATLFGKELQCTQITYLMVYTTY